jgi:hypothetical protein
VRLLVKAVNHENGEARNFLELDEVSVDNSCPCVLVPVLLSQLDLLCDFGGLFEAENVGVIDEEPDNFRSLACLAIFVV